MKIHVQLFATLSRYLPDQDATLELPDGSTVRDVLDRLRIPKEIPVIALVNGRDVASEQTIHDGDTLTMFPPLAGGDNRTDPP